MPPPTYFPGGRPGGWYVDAGKKSQKFSSFFPDVFLKTMYEEQPGGFPLGVCTRHFIQQLDFDR